MTDSGSCSVTLAFRDVILLANFNNDIRGRRWKHGRSIKGDDRRRGRYHILIPR